MADTALSSIEQSYSRFKSVVSTSDAYEFSRTELVMVEDAVREIEERLAAKAGRKALRRIAPLLKALGHYSEAMSVVCNGTPYLPWIWAPIKLILEITSDYLSAFDKLIEAYAEIGAALPRFDKIGVAAKNDPAFQTILAVFYSEILAFHLRAYRYFRARAWKRFFNATWGFFDVRFAAIIDSLRRHAALVDKEIDGYELARTQRWRQLYLEQVHMFEETRLRSTLRASQTVQNGSDIELSRMASPLVSSVQLPGTTQFGSALAPVRPDITSVAESPIWKISSFLHPCWIIILLGGVVIAGSLAVGLYYSIAEDRMADGFTVAGWIIAVGTLVLAVPITQHYPSCKCWQKSAADQAHAA